MTSESEHKTSDDWVDVAETYKKRFTHLAQRVDDTFGVNEKLETSKQYAAEHPIVAMTTVIAIAMGSVPVLCFMAFVLGTFCCTFMGFLFIEGVLLTFGGMLLGFVLCIAAMVTLILSVFVAVSWLTFNYGCHFIQKTVDCCKKETPAETVEKED